MEKKKSRSDKKKIAYIDSLALFNPQKKVIGFLDFALFYTHDVHPRMRRVTLEIRLKKFFNKQVIGARVLPAWTLKKLIEAKDRFHEIQKRKDSKPVKWYNKDLWKYADKDRVKKRYVLANVGEAK